MRRGWILLLLTLASVAAGQVQPLEQGGTVWFYYPDEKPSPYGSPTILHIGGLTRILAKVAPGEYFGYPVAAGVHVFSYTRAPARNETLSISIKPGEELYVEVHFRELTRVSPEIGKLALQQSHPIRRVGVFDSSVLVGGATPVKRPPPPLIASTADTDTRLRPQADAVPTPPTTLILSTADADTRLRPQANVVSIPPLPQQPPAAISSPPPKITPAAAAALTPDKVASNPPSAAIPVLTPDKAASSHPPAATPTLTPKEVGSGHPPAATPVSKPKEVATNPPPAATPVSKPKEVSSNPPRDAAVPPPSANVPPGPPANATESFQKATLNLQTDGKKREIDVVVMFDKEALVITDKKDRAVLKLFPYASIKGAEYAYARSPRWKAPMTINMALPPEASRVLKHWFLVHTQDDYAVVELDKANYNLILEAFELRAGKKIELAGDLN